MIYNSLFKILLLKDKIGLKPSEILWSISKWTRSGTLDGSEIARETTILRWTGFYQQESLDEVINLFCSWLYNLPNLIKLKTLTKILNDSSLNDEINSAICYPDSCSFSRRLNIIDKISKPFIGVEFEILNALSDFFVLLYREGDDTEKELFSEALMALSSLMLGNKKPKDIEKYIFEVELLSRLIKMLILTRGCEDESYLTEMPDVSNFRGMLSKSLGIIPLDSVDASRIVGSIPRNGSQKRGSNSTINSLLNVLAPLKGSNIVKSKFGSNVTDYLSIYSERSSFLINADRRMSAFEKPQIPLMNLEIPEENQEAEKSAQIELVSNRFNNSNTTFGIVQNFQTKIQPKQRKSGFSLKSNDSEMKEKVEPVKKRFKTGKTKAVLESSGEDSFEDELNQ